MNHSIVYSNVRINESTHSLRFFMESPVHPGQFIMIWAPGIGEIPISFSSVNNPVEITVKIYGEPSKYIANLMPGELSRAIWKAIHRCNWKKANYRCRNRNCTVNATC